MLPVHHVAESVKSERVRVFLRDRNEVNMNKFRDKLCAVDWSEIESEDVGD